jgi:hypothetical protein
MYSVVDPAPRTVDTHEELRRELMPILMGPGPYCKESYVMPDVGEILWFSYENPVSRQHACGVMRASTRNVVALGIETPTSTKLELCIPLERLVWHSSYESFESSE